jgi:hypothetical protein
MWADSLEGSQLWQMLFNHPFSFLVFISASAFYLKKGQIIKQIWNPDLSFSM